MNEPAYTCACGKTTTDLLEAFNHLLDALNKQDEGQPHTWKEPGK